MRRTQLYLDDDLWDVLHARARDRKSTVSQLVREAVRERYLPKKDQQAKAMREFIGIRKQSPARPSAVQYIRSLRGGGRLDRLHHE